MPTNHSSDSSDLPTAANYSPGRDRDRLAEMTIPSTIDEQARRRFEEAWLKGKPEPIENHVPAPDNPLYLATLEELILIELEFGWKQGSSPSRLESFLGRFPALNEPARVLRLLREEYRVRCRHGDAPSIAEYRQRFPDIALEDHDFEQADASRGFAREEPYHVEGYEILGVLGQGGMGVVLKAKQTRIQRIVAIKMLLPNAVASTSDLLRFRTEVEATASLQHAHIVRVFEFGECGGRPFYTMEYINGPTLQQRISEGPVAGRVAARYMALVARSIHHAHEHGILHRDLKPSNVLLDGNDQPHVTDFGIAKRLTGDAGPTRTGSIVGTPSYMAPEQASGRKDLTPLTDVYGLGALLYALLTGRPPFLAETLTDTLMQVLERVPPPPRLLNPNVDRDLETICLKCLEKDPRLRYASAEAIARDLERYLAGEPITARNVNLFDRLARTLGHSARDVEFHQWGTLLFVIGVTVLICHSANYIAWQMGQPLWIRWITGTFQFVVIALAFWRLRPGRLLPETAAERQLWTIWIGYFLASGAAALIDAQLFVREEAGVRTDISRWTMYPYSALLSGLAFFVMGSGYWGGCYLIGLGFLVVAAIMPQKIETAPLLFALMWSATLCTLGLHLRQIGRGEKQACEAPHQADTVTKLERRA